MFDILNNSGKKKLFASNLSILRRKWEGGGEHESAGHKANGFEHYFDFGFQCMHTHQDSSTHGRRGVMKQALPNKIVKARRGPSQPQLCQGIKNSLLWLERGLRNNKGLNTTKEYCSQLKKYSEVGSLGLIQWLYHVSNQDLPLFCSTIPSIWVPSTRSLHYLRWSLQLQAIQEAGRRGGGKGRMPLSAVYTPLIFLFPANP